MAERGNEYSIFGPLSSARALVEVVGLTNGAQLAKASLSDLSLNAMASIVDLHRDWGSPLAVGSYFVSVRGASESWGMIFSLEADGNIAAGLPPSLRVNRWPPK